MRPRGHTVPQNPIPRPEAHIPDLVKTAFSCEGPGRQVAQRIWTESLRSMSGIKPLEGKGSILQQGLTATPRAHFPNNWLSLPFMCQPLRQALGMEAAKCHLLCIFSCNFHSCYQCLQLGITHRNPQNKIYWRTSEPSLLYRGN